MDETLLELEEAGWQALSSDKGAEFYRHQLTDDALVVVPGMVIDRTTFLRALQSETQPWAGHRIEEPRVIQFTPECAAVVYRAVAHREGQPEYIALMSSVYVQRNGGWKLIYHQQTPGGPT